MVAVPESPITQLPRRVTVLLSALVLFGLILALGQWFVPRDAPALVESTPGQLSLWVAGQTERLPENAWAEAAGDRWTLLREQSLLALLTRATVAGDVMSEAVALERARFVLGLLGLLAAGAAGWTLWQARREPAGARALMVWPLLAYLVLLLNVPALTDQIYYPLTLLGLALAAAAGFIAPGRLPAGRGFIVIIASLLLSWEVYKWLGDLSGNTLPLTDFPWKLPHWQDIIAELLQPARRNGPHLLLRILSSAALITWAEAALGFAAGSLLGFGLGVLFAHNRLLERGLLPYVVASQTVPIIAIAPMIVVWFGPSWTSVAVISAYLAFFPVTVNTLRGLMSPDALQLDLMRSYAATRSTILWKLRLPAALPFIFTALKVASTACVVGAIVGELPSGRTDGLAAAILRASGNYAAEPEKLWAAILLAAAVGIVFFNLVSAGERQLTRGWAEGG